MLAGERFNLTGVLRTKKENIAGQDDVAMMARGVRESLCEEKALI